MTVTNLAAVSNQIQKYWSPMFTKELRSQLLLGSLVNREYEGEIKAGGDTVYVSSIAAPTGSNLTVGTNADQFSSEAVSMTRISVQANKRAVAAFEIEDLAKLQSQLDSQDSELRASLLHAVNSQINTYLYSLVSPSTSAPDHDIGSVTDFTAAQLSAVRKLAAQAKWGKEKPWYLLADPSYYSDIIDDTTLAGADYGATDRPIIGGQMALPRMGFNVLEDNSSGLTDILTSDSEDIAVAFHPDFMHLVMQTQATVKLSDLHSQKKFGYLLSVDIIYGAALGVAGNKKHIKITNNG